MNISYIYILNLHDNIHIAYWHLQIYDPCNQENMVYMGTSIVSTAKLKLSTHMYNIPINHYYSFWNFDVPKACYAIIINHEFKLYHLNMRIL